jgi:leucyl-tRNA synthetase
MFIGPWEEGGPWNSKGIEGVQRFLHRVWVTALQAGDEGMRQAQPTEEQIADLRRITHKTIRKVTQDMDRFQFNTMLAALMEFNNYLVRAKGTEVYGSDAWNEAVRDLVLMLAPTAPHLTEEIWSRMGGEYSIHQQAWPRWDDDLAADEVITLVVQVNGKVRDTIPVPADISEEAARELALSSEGAARHIEGKQIVRVIYVKGRLVNIVIR